MCCKGRLRAFAKQSMTEDLERMEYLPGQMYNFHPGSHVKQGVDQGIEYDRRMFERNLVPWHENDRSIGSHGW